MADYKTGTGDQQIKLAVDIDTIGLAASNAKIFRREPPVPAKTVAHSDDASGDIQRQDIGTALDLKTKILSLYTKIDIPGKSVDERKKECERLSGKYILENGDDGHKEFVEPNKEHSDDYRVASLYYEIQLNP